MIGQTGDNPTFGHSSAGALRDDPAQLGPKCRQLPNPPVNFGQLFPRQRVNIGAGLVGMIGQAQQLFGGFKRKAEVAGVADELQAGDVGGAILAAVAPAAGRIGQQTTLFIKSDRGYFDTGLPGHIADRGVLHVDSPCSYSDYRCDKLKSETPNRKRAANMSAHHHDHDDHHGHSHDVDFDGLTPAYRRALWAVIAINAVMFAVEIGAGSLAGSQALKADALDFLADSVTYGLSLAVLGMPLIRRANVAIFKGISLLAMGIWVFGSTLWQVVILGLPQADVMGIVGLMALAANVASVLILLRFKDGDANVRSVWLCSRNDAIGNVAVIAAAGAVALTQTAWPDLIVAALMAGLFLSSARLILAQALRERQAALAGTTAA